MGWERKSTASRRFLQLSQSDFEQMFGTTKRPWYLVVRSLWSQLCALWVASLSSHQSAELTRACLCDDRIPFSALDALINSTQLSLHFIDSFIDSERIILLGCTWYCEVLLLALLLATPAAAWNLGMTEGNYTCAILRLRLCNMGDGVAPRIKAEPSPPGLKTSQKKAADKEAPTHAHTHMYTQRFGQLQDPDGTWDDDWDDIVDGVDEGSDEDQDDSKFDPSEKTAFFCKRRRRGGSCDCRRRQCNSYCGLTNPECTGCDWKGKCQVKFPGGFNPIQCNACIACNQGC